MANLTIAGAIHNNYDESMLDRLAVYCRHMKIGMSTQQLNQYIKISFDGSDQALDELRTHLEGIER